MVVGLAPRTWACASETFSQVNVLLDTHFLLWLVLESNRRTQFPWLHRYRPWGVSPVSFLEIQFLAEGGETAHIRVQYADLAFLAAHDTEHNSAVVLKAFVEGRLTPVL